ncbi:MAG TPA: hypothetical protein VF578_12600, partial [Methylomirabilota bacterium]
MTEATRPTQFGRIHAPDAEWLARNPPEPILEPDLPIIDTHHHLWDRNGHRYVLHDFLADVATGHTVVATIFLECHAMYRAGGPEEMRPVGETEFVTGQAAMSASRPTGFGRIHAPDESYLGALPPEPIIEPDLPIIDTHHHLWERPDHRYLLHEFLADARSGHNLIASVFMECHAMYRAHGP